MGGWVGGWAGWWEDVPALLLGRKAAEDGREAHVIGNNQRRIERLKVQHSNWVCIDTGTGLEDEGNGFQRVLGGP